MIQHERQLYGTQPKGSGDSMTMMAPTSNVNYAGQQGGWKPGAQKGKTLFCTFCKMQNHTIDRCFFKIGFPPGVTPRPMPQSISRPPTAARPPTHQIIQAINLKLMQLHNQVKEGQSSWHMTNFPSLWMHCKTRVDWRLQPLQAHTQQQHLCKTQKASASLKKTLSSTTTKNVNWIVDTGASDHGISSMDLFTTSQSILGSWSLWL